MSRWLFISLVLLGTNVHAASHFAIERGRYLAAAGDCAACHTAEGGEPYAGGRPIPTPFGTIYSTNITPDSLRGIGRWTEEQFYTALHEGVRADGKHLYPAFPYPWYTKLTREDTDSLKAFLDTLPPSKLENRKPDLPWPLSVRAVLTGWNMLFFREGTYQPDPAKSAEWNRGAYLVEGLGHCGACHTPKNALGGIKRSRHLQGGYGENWFATSLTADARDGIGNWLPGDIVEYLKTGANAKGAATGPMAEVIENSTQHMSQEDLAAMAVYLKSIGGRGKTETPEDDKQRLARGQALYLDQCSGCHMKDGNGQAGAFPPLRGNAVVQANDPGTMLHMIVDGARVAITEKNPTGLAMPGYGWKLSDQEIADLASYLRGAWGNSAGPVSSSKVKQTRKRVAEGSR